MWPRTARAATALLPPPLMARLTEPNLEIGKLFRLVTDDVLDATGNRQRPFVYGSVSGREDFYFTVK